MPLRIHELDIIGLAEHFNEKRIRTTQGKIIQPLHDAHREILADPARFKVFAGGRRVSKTLIASLVSIAVLFQPRRRITIVAPTYALSEKVWREIYSILVTQMQVVIPGKKGKARNQPGNYYLETEWGSVVECKSAENRDSLVGEANDLVIVDEAGLIGDLDNIWTQMIRPSLMDKQGSALFISTPRGKNGFYKLYMNGELGKKQREGLVKITTDLESGLTNDFTDWSSFRKTSYDNPLLAATPEQAKIEIDSAYREAVLSGKLQKFKQEYLADFEAVADSVFSGFTEEISELKPSANVIDYIWHPMEGPVYAAMDHNLAKPSSTIFAQVNQFNDVVIFDECFTKNTTSYMQGQQIVDKEKQLNKIAWGVYNEEHIPMSARKNIIFKDLIGDISGQQRQLSGRTAWDDIEAVTGRKPVGLKQDRVTGVNMTNLWLQFPMFDSKGRPLLNEHTNEQKTFPKLFINRNCTNLRYAISTATFKKTKNGSLKDDYEETPEGYEGLLDALRYLLVYLFHDKGQYFVITKGV